MRIAAVVAALVAGPVIGASVCGAGAAAAQPIEPVPPPAPPVADEVDESVAFALLERARTLSGEGAYADAKQLVVEALARRPGPVLEVRARALLDELNQRLGISDRPPAPVEPIAPPAVVPEPVVAPPPPPPPPRPSGRAALATYGVLAGATFGAGVVGLDEPATTVGALVAGGLVGGLLGNAIARRSGYDRAAAHVIGSGVLWGAAAGGMFADVASGLAETSDDDIAIGVGIGAVAGGLLGVALRNEVLTVGDAALIDSIAGWSTLAAFQLAIAIDPPETEAYTLNGAIGAAGGYLIGHVAARNREVSGARLAKVNGIAALGASAPWLVWALVKDESSSDDEKAFGWLSIAGLSAGIYFGFRWTSDPPPSAAIDDAPGAVVRRSSRGAWSMGGPALTPVRGAPGRDGADSRGLAVTLVGGAW